MGLCHLKSGIKGSYPGISMLEILQDGVPATKTGFLPPDIGLDCSVRRRIGLGRQLVS